jgi:hypothetical protein
MTPVLIGLVFLTMAGLICMAVLFLHARRSVAPLEHELEDLRTKYETDTRRLAAYGRSLEKKNERLGKWASVVDAEEKAEELLQSGEQALRTATAQADAIQSQARALSLNAEAQARALVDHAQARSVSSSTPLTARLTRRYRACVTTTPAR